VVVCIHKALVLREAVEGHAEPGFGRHEYYCFVQLHAVLLVFKCNATALIWLGRGASKLLCASNANLFTETPGGLAGRPEIWVMACDGPHCFCPVCGDGCTCMATREHIIPSPVYNLSSD